MRPSRPTGLQTVRRAAAVALFFQWAIVVTGATVRLTGSGLGCPSWPTCTDTRPVPALEHHAMIEFVNRMMSAPTLVSALVAAWLAWRLQPARFELRLATALVVGGVLVQAGIGAMTVLLHLPPAVVGAHFVVSVFLLAAATFAWHAAGSPVVLTPPPRRLRLRALVAISMLVCLLLVIVAGVLTTAAGPHSGAAGSGMQVERFGAFDVVVALHARGAYAFLGLVLVLSWWRRRRATALRDLGLLLGLVVLQIALGELQYRTGLPWEVVLAHVANAGLVWIVACRIAFEAMRADTPERVVAGAADQLTAPPAAVPSRS